MFGAASDYSFIQNLITADRYLTMERKYSISVFKVIDQIQELSPCAAVRYRIKRILKKEVDSDLCK
jgi:hypothetical protein